MVCEERTEMKHDKKGGIFSMLRRSLITSGEDPAITSQARYLRQSHYPIHVGPVPPK